MSSMDNNYCKQFFSQLIVAFKVKFDFSWTSLKFAFSSKRK